MCMATNVKTGERVSAGQALSRMAQEAAAPPPAAPAMTPLPPMPPMPTLPPMPTVQAPQIPAASGAVAGPQATGAAPTAKQGGRPSRRRRGGEGMGSLSIGSTQSAAGTGLNIGR